MASRSSRRTSRRRKQLGRQVPLSSLTWIGYIYEEDLLVTEFLA